MLERQICGDTSRIGFQRYVMRCVGRRRGGEVREIYGGGMKRRRMQFKEIKHTKPSVKTVLRRII